MAVETRGQTPFQSLNGDDLTVEASLLEGLLQRSGVPLSDALRAELRAQGVDPERLAPRYSPRQWFRVVDAVRRHTYPELPVEAGLRRLGRQFAEGFFQTIIGKVLAVGVEVMGPAAMLRLAPRSFRAGRKDAMVIPVQEGENAWRLEVRQALPMADYTAGLAEVAGERAGVKFDVQVVRRSDDGFVLAIRW